MSKINQTKLKRMKHAFAAINILSTLESKLEPLAIHKQATIWLLNHSEQIITNNWGFS